MMIYMPNGNACGNVSIIGIVYFQREIKCFERKHIENAYENRMMQITYRSRLFTIVVPENNHFLLQHLHLHRIELHLSVIYQQHLSGNNNGFVVRLSRIHSTLKMQQISLWRHCVHVNESHSSVYMQHTSIHIIVQMQNPQFDSST